MLCFLTAEKFAKAALHCEASCKTVEAFYGPDSIELANELFKLSQLQFNAYVDCINIFYDILVLSC